MPWTKVPVDLLSNLKFVRLSLSAQGTLFRLWLLAAQFDMQGALIDPDGSILTADDLVMMTRTPLAQAGQFITDMSELTDAGLISADEQSAWWIGSFQDINPMSQEERRAKWRNQKAKQSTGADVPQGFRAESEEKPQGILSGEESREEKSREEERERREEISGDSDESRPPASNPPKPSRKSTADPRTEHPAIKAIHAVMGKFPHKDTYDSLILALGTSPDIEKLRECWRAWRAKNYRPDNLGWAIDWYSQGGPPKQNQTQRPVAESPPNEPAGYANLRRAMGVQT